ncbi:hypothetical protein SAMN06295955_105128 [Sphingopyxis indica]|uniref:Uncharacterized protein n=1 Tax=Sphingopyxis indica TaxID=436663 RepID=A0A239HF46_9SPHN|nr:hypothetical protein SAMN06295955_105128 [Sphingopyxis indica]
MHGCIPTDMPDIRLRQYPVGDEEWRHWLALVPLLPARNAWSIDAFFERAPRYFSRIPPVAALLPHERNDLLVLFRDYARALRQDQRKSRWRGRVDVGLGLAAFVSVPFSWAVSAVSFGVLLRNQYADRQARLRRDMLISLSEWIEELL